MENGEEALIGVKTVAKFRRSFSSAPSSGYDIARAAIEHIADSSLKWPADDRGLTRVFHAIYVEPDGMGGIQPSAFLRPRVYCSFDIGWPVRPVVWFDYGLGLDVDAHAVGDVAFPSATPEHCHVGGWPSGAVVNTYEPGDLLVTCEAGVSSNTLAALVERDFGGSVKEEIGPDVFLVACPGFDEGNCILALQSAPEIKFVELNYHVSLIAPGGYWLVSTLL